MEIDKNKLEELAKMIKVRLTDEEKKEIQIEINSFFELIEKIVDVETKDLEPTYSITNNQNVFNEDNVVTNHKKEFLENAPETKDNFVEVPSVIKEK